MAKWALVEIPRALVEDGFLLRDADACLRGTFKKGFPFPLLRYSFMFRFDASFFSFLSKVAGGSLPKEAVLKDRCIVEV